MAKNTTVPAGAKQPEDKKKAKHAVNERFEFTLSTGDVIHAKYVENIPYKVFKNLSSMEDVEGQDELLRAVLGDDFAVWDENVLMGEMMDFLNEWQEASAITLGEAGAS